jgi:hypothetical protein
VSHKKALGRREARRKIKFQRLTRATVGSLAYVFLGGAVLFLAAVIVLASRQLPATTAQSSSALATRAAATSAAQGGWIRLTAKTPGAIIAAARKSSLFNVNRSGNGDYLKDISHLETPVLVRAVRVTGSASMPDYYVIPIDDTSGKMVGAAELALNPTGTAIQVTSIITYTHPRPHGQLAQISATMALADVASQQHVALRAGAQPQLVYIPIDATLLETGQITWNSGGTYPGDPAWLIPGADGKDLVVGTDGRAYFVANLPIMKQP